MHFNTEIPSFCFSKVISIRTMGTSIKWLKWCNTVGVCMCVCVWGVVITRFFATMLLRCGGLNGNAVVSSCYKKQFTCCDMCAAFHLLAALLISSSKSTPALCTCQFVHNKYVFAFIIQILCPTKSFKGCISHKFKARSYIWIISLNKDCRCTVSPATAARWWGWKRGK